MRFYVNRWRLAIGYVIGYLLASSCPDDSTPAGRRVLSFWLTRTTLVKAAGLVRR